MKEITIVKSVVLAPECKVKIIIERGSLWIYNYKFNCSRLVSDKSSDELPVFEIESSKFSSALVLEPSNDEGGVVLKYNVESVGNENHNDAKPLFLPLEDAIQRGIKVYSFPPSWHFALSQITNKSSWISSPYGTLICGPKNSGKSSLSRFLANGLLPLVGSVYLLDLDSGQPEFTPCGIISLCQIKNPLLTADCSSDHYVDIIHSCYVGSASLKEYPETYLKASRMLLDMANALQSSSSNPIHVIINTPGWIKGLGLDFLRKVASHSLVKTGIVVMEEGRARTFSAQVFHGDNSQSVIFVEARTSSTHPKCHNNESRAHGLMQHLIQRDRHVITVNPCDGTKFIQFLSDGLIPHNKVLHALNGSLVALLFCPALRSLFTAAVANPLKSNLQNSTIRLLEEMQPIPNRWIGYAVIVAVEVIAPQNNISLKISTCVSQSDFNVIAVSKDLALPSDFMTLFNNCANDLPFFDARSDDRLGALGSKSRKFRGNLLRKTNSC